jgi:hypothetical protein
VVVAFATLILGLVIGSGDVALEVGQGVARVVVSLDGAQVSEASAPPWSVSVDFGEELAPHELVATAFDADGRELGKARQWINRPRAPAEVSVVIERRGDVRTARLVWASVTGEQPLVTSVTVDGQAIAFTDPRAIPLPPSAPDRYHVLHVELDFADGVSASADIAYGGGRTDEASAHLTALPVTLLPKAKMPKLDRLGGWFASAGGETLRVAAVEEGPAQVVLVPEVSARAPLRSLAFTLGYERAFHIGLLAKGQRLRFVWPVAERRTHSGFSYSLFPRSEEFSSGDGGVLWLVAHLRQREPGASETQRLADAVAAAALEAAGRDRRRAVVLLLGPESPATDESTLGAARVRRYLARIGVPFFVWCVDRESDPVWGACTSLSSTGKIQRAANDVKHEIDRQRIVWLEGTLLPHTIALTPSAIGLAAIH